jgi:hypothetical protein
MGSAFMRHSLSYRGWLESSNAEVAPLDEFIDEVMAILKTQPVKKVYPPRFSAEHGQQKYEEFFEQFNDAYAGNNRRERNLNSRSRSPF